jgi:hypothetical protein
LRLVAAHGLQPNFSCRWCRRRQKIREAILTQTRGLGAPEARVCYQHAEPMFHSLHRPELLYSGLMSQWVFSLVTDTAMQQAWRRMAVSALEAAGTQFERSQVCPDFFSGILKQIEASHFLAVKSIDSIRELEGTARKVYNQSVYAYDPSSDEAQKFINLCGAVQADLLPVQNPQRVPEPYVISDHDYSRFNKRIISFEGILIGQKVLNGTGKLEIQRQATRGRADIVINEWFGTYGSTRYIHLGEKPFRRIVDRGNELFLEGKLCR